MFFIFRRDEFFKVASFSAAVELSSTSLSSTTHGQALETESEKETFRHLILLVDVHVKPYEEGGKGTYLDIKDSLTSVEASLSQYCFFEKHQYMMFLQI